MGQIELLNFFQYLKPFDYVQTNDYYQIELFNINDAVSEDGEFVY